MDTKDKIDDVMKKYERRESLKVDNFEEYMETEKIREDDMLDMENVIMFVEILRENDTDNIPLLDRISDFLINEEDEDEIIKTVCGLLEYYNLLGKDFDISVLSGKTQISIIEGRAIRSVFEMKLNTDDAKLVEDIRARTVRITKSKQRIKKRIRAKRKKGFQVVSGSGGTRFVRVKAKTRLKRKRGARRASRKLKARRKIIAKKVAKRVKIKRL